MTSSISQKKVSPIVCLHPKAKYSETKEIIKRLVKENEALNKEFNELMKLFVEQKKQLIILNKATKDYLEKKK